MVSERWRVFLDTNVLVAGVVSQTGASAATLDLGEAEEMILLVSRQVLVEADRTFLAKFPQHMERYRLFIKNVAPLLVNDPSMAEIREAAQVIHHHDAPIVAAAKHEGVESLVTLNTRHFSAPVVRKYLNAPIVTPAEFLVAFRTCWEEST